MGRIAKKGVHAAGKLCRVAWPVGAVMTAVDIHDIAQAVENHFDESKFDLDSFFKKPLHEQTNEKLNGVRTNYFTFNLAHPVMRYKCERSADGKVKKIELQTHPTLHRDYNEQGFHTETFEFDKNGKLSMAYYKAKKQDQNITYNFTSQPSKTIKYFDEQTNKQIQLPAEKVFSGQSPTGTSSNFKNAQYFTNHIDRNLAQIVACCHDTKCTTFYNQKMRQAEILKKTIEIPTKKSTQ